MSAPSTEPGCAGCDAEFSEHETALYSKDMLDTLRSIAVLQHHHRLAELLGAAAVEAERLANLSEDRVSGK